MARERSFSEEELFRTTGELLLKSGYEGFTFSLLANELSVSRGTLYKYYENKEELIVDYMIYEMKDFLSKLKEIHMKQSFDEQFDYLLALIFENSNIHQLIEMGSSIPLEKDSRAQLNKERMNQMHIAMYEELMEFIHLGKKEQRLKSEIPDSLLLGIIFQSISIPNHYRVPREIWVSSIKEVLCHGMFTKR